MKETNNGSIDITFFADESGHLHSNSPKRYFVIGGYFCLAEKSKIINQRFKRTMWKIKKKRNMGTSEELKTRNMTVDEKNKLIATLQESDGFNGFAIVVDKDQMFRRIDRESIFYNYFIKQIISTILIPKVRNSFHNIQNITVDMTLDNRNVSVGHLKGLEDYLNSNYVMTEYSFKTNYGNSSGDYRIQACDLIANTIYEWFKEPHVVMDVIKNVDFDRIVVIGFPKNIRYWYKEN